MEGLDAAGMFETDTVDAAAAADVAVPKAPADEPLPLNEAIAVALDEGPTFVAALTPRLAVIDAAVFAANLLNGFFFCGVVSKGSARRRPKLTAAIVDFVVAAEVVGAAADVVVIVVADLEAEVAGILGAMETDPIFDRVPTVTDPGAG